MERWVGRDSVRYKEKGKKRESEMEIDWEGRRDRKRRGITEIM